MTGRALLVFVSARTLAATAALLALTAVFASCGDAQEDVGPDTQPSTMTSSPSSTAATATPVVTTEPSPASVPSGWQTYVDPVLWFSFAFPAGFSSIDATAQTPLCCPVRRFVELRPAGSKDEGLVVGVYEDVGDLSIREWAQTFSMCNLEVRPGTDITVDARPAMVCIGEPLEGRLDYWVIVKDTTRIVYVSAALSEADFQSIVDTFRFPRR